MSTTYTKYDFVWEEEGELVGYKSVIESGVDVDVISDGALRQHLMKNSGVHYVQPRPALKKPFDLVWEVDGVWRGFLGAVNSRLDPARLPAELAVYFKPTRETESLPHEYCSYAESENPIYQRTSQMLGDSVTTVTPSKLDQSQVWTGLSGKFTATFPSTGAIHSGSLNCSMNRHSVTKGPSFGTTPYFEPRAT